MLNMKLKALCLAVLLSILVAGLWPFNFFPENRVEWLPDRDGVRHNHFDYSIEVSNRL